MIEEQNIQSSTINNNIINTPPPTYNPINNKKTILDFLFINNTSNINTTSSITSNNLSNETVKNNSSNIEHEATTSKVSEDQLQYCLQRGISNENAISLIVNGFCKNVLNELPMEFAVEAKALLSVNLEGAVG